MSNKHITAVNRCSHPALKGNTRLLLFILADAASNGSGKSPFGAGWTAKSLPTLMLAMGTRRRDTVGQAMSTLVAIGAIERKQRQNESALTFVDLDWLHRHQDVPESVSSQDELGSTEKRDSPESVSSSHSDNLDDTFFVSDDTESVSQAVPNSGTLTVFEPSYRTEEICNKAEKQQQSRVTGSASMEGFIDDSHSHSPERVEKLSASTKTKPSSAARTEFLHRFWIAGQEQAADAWAQSERESAA